ncbi:hypothetical protein [Nocardia sp. alder85J]|uniref:hypothetical protein n=1 Tax=Nocardia sp. alder85J TaxID=2862949 RepID=UPI001CD210F7|nr:hypothetical protein [Nocardia sp. alder85J]MCX4092188.1 hypothetical protein [Nocardia sp. alder85J]
MMGNRLTELMRSVLQRLTRTLPEAGGAAARATDEIGQGIGTVAGTASAADRTTAFDDLERQMLAPVRGQDLIRTATPDDLRRLADRMSVEDRLGAGAATDPALTEIARRQGFDGLPSLVTREQFDAAEGTELHLVTGESHAEQVISGTYPATYDPLDGSGIHLGWGTAADRPAGPGAVTLRIKLKPGARTVDVTDLAVDSSDRRAALLGAIRLLGDQSSPKVWAARKRELYAQRDVYANLGRFAALRGYDAYFANGRWVVLNRTALTITR